MLENFKQTGGNVGVGLAGMRERVREQGGHFDIQSDRNGTTITVVMPTAAESTPPLTAPLPAD